MKNSIVAITLVTLLMIVGVMSAAAVTGKDEPDESVESKIAALQKERIETLEQVVQGLKEQHRMGQVNLQEFFAAQSDLIEARLELATTKAERLVLLKEHLDVAKEVEATIESRTKIGLRGGTPLEYLRARSARLQREIALLRETNS